MTVDERRELYQRIIDNLGELNIYGIGVDEAVSEAIAEVHNGAV